MHALKRNEMRKLYSIFETGGPKMSEAISFVGILSGIQAAKGPNIILISDCCHSGGVFRQDLDSLDCDVRNAPSLTMTDGIIPPRSHHPRVHSSPRSQFL